MAPPAGFQMTLQTQAVLRVLLDHPLQEHYGLEISKAFTSTEVVYGVTGTDVSELPEYGVSP